MRKLYINLLVVFAFLGFAVFQNVSAGTLVAQRQSQKDLSMSDKLASEWLTKAYFAETKSPDVVVLGNDQLGPLLGADAYVYNRLVDIAGDHRSKILEHNLKGLLNDCWSVFIAGLPNAMISDQFLIVRALFSHQYKPKLVAITLSPKEFINSFCSSPTSTEAFAFFSNYIDFGSDLNLFGNDEARYKRFSHNIVSIQKIIEDDQRNICHETNPNISYPERVLSFSLGKPFEYICPGERVISAGDRYLFYDNLGDYRKRYTKPYLPQFKIQLHCLEALLRYLSELQIKVVVFDLPLTTANRKLLPESFWSFYHQEISQACKIYNADWIDIDKDVKGFSDKEFMDSVHLNLVGGHRLASTLALYIANKFHWKTFAELEANEKNML